MERKGLGEKIKELRLRSALSQEELAEVSGLSLRSIQRIENNKTVPRGDSLKRIANALNINIEELTNDPGMKYINSVISLKEDPKITLILILSVFAYLLSPMLGFIFPFVVWMLCRNTTRGVQEIGLKIIRFELVWCTILTLVYAYIFCNKFFQLNLPVPGNSKAVTVFIAAMYIVNFCAILRVLFTWIKLNKAIKSPV